MNEKILISNLKKKIKMYEDREAILNRISPEVCSVIDLDKFLQATVNEVGKMMEVSRCDLMVNSEDGLLEIKYEYKVNKDIPSSLNLTLPSENIGNKKLPMGIDNVSLEPLPMPLKRMLNKIKTLSVLFVPITFQDSLLGIIGLHHCFKHHSWSPSEISFIKSLAQQIAIAFQYTKLYTEKEKEVEITKTLLKIANEINTILDFGKITSFIVEKAVSLLQSDFGCLGILDSSKRILHFTTFRPTSLHNVRRIKKGLIVTIDNPLFNKAVAERLPVDFRSSEDNEPAMRMLKDKFKAEAALIAPILIGDKIFGTLNLFWTRKRKRFNFYEFELIKGITNQTSIILEKEQLTSEVLRLRNELKGAKASKMILGNSEKIKKCIEMALYVADSNTTVLLQGESGVGKELIADLIHYSSSRQTQPYIKINCGAIPEALLESELFGHEKGAFTDARNKRIGKFEEADGGTLFLDEIGELSLSAQVKLLRVLQDGEFTRVGGNELIKTSVRVIAATNANLEEAVKAGKFRQDLYYRLNVYPIYIPPLRERKEDIPILVNHFIDIYKKANNKNLVGISERALRVLCSYDWPGNIRELQNVIERAVIMAKDKIITIEDLPKNLRITVENLKKETIELELGSTMDEIEKKVILETISFAKGNKNKAAQILGIGRRTLYRKLKNISL